MQLWRKRRTTESPLLSTSDPHSTPDANNVCTLSPRPYLHHVAPQQVVDVLIQIRELLFDAKQLDSLHAELKALRIT